MADEDPSARAKTVSLDLTPLIAECRGKAPPHRDAARAMLAAVAPRYKMLVPGPKFLVAAIGDHEARIEEFKTTCSMPVRFAVRFRSEHPLWKAVVLQSWEDEDTVNLGVKFLWFEHRDLFYRDADVFERLWSAREERRRRAYRMLQHISAEYLRTVAFLLGLGARSPQSPLALLADHDRRHVAEILIAKTHQQQ
jgi:hypothetical protein